MSTALVLSLLFHALLLSLTFGSQEFGFPGLDLPWRERRFEAGDLRVALVPTQVTAAAPASIEPAANRMPTGVAPPEPMAAPGAKVLVTPSLAGVSENVTSPPLPAPALIASEPSNTTTEMAVTPSVPTPVIAAVPSATSPSVVISTPPDESDAAQKQTDFEVQQRVLELAKLNRAKQEAQQQADQKEEARELATRQQAERQEAARQAAAQKEIERAEGARVDAKRQDVARAEAARVEAESQEAARQAAARKEAAQADAERQEVARQAAARQDAERLGTARAEADRQEAARQESAKQEKQRQVAARAAQEARREEVLRAIGKQLDEEAAKRDAARQSPKPLASSSSGRRVRLFGRADPNADLILYAEAWSRKIELNMTFDMVREAAKQRHTNPLVTVALRSDGSVESVNFVISSGVPEIDEAIRRIVQSQAPYPSFPPGLAREYDVVEIRRTWAFDMAIRLF